MLATSCSSSENLASRRDDAPPVIREVLDIDIQGHVAGPRLGALRLYNAAVDAALAAGFDEAIIDSGMLNLPVEDLLVKVRHFGRIFR